MCETDCNSQRSLKLIGQHKNNGKTCFTKVNSVYHGAPYMHAHKNRYYLQLKFVLLFVLPCLSTI